MTSTPQQSISKMRLRAASAALMLVAVLVLGLVAPQSAQARTFTVLYNFTRYSDGASPYAGLTRDAAGNLYGSTTNGGGKFNCNSSGCGVVFSVSKSGNESVLYSFCLSDAACTDGVYPRGNLIRDAEGDLYGTTSEGGDLCAPHGCGTVFKVDTSGKETVLYSFGGSGSDGGGPYGGLLRDEAGNLYGTTLGGGASDYGTVFKVDTTGAETVLHSFAGGQSDGALPRYTSMIMDRTGNLYGVTAEGGTSNDGVVYELSKSGRLTVLHSFAGGPTDGCAPYGTPAMDKDGNLYGTTTGCGYSGNGTAWKVSKNGVETVLHNFAGYQSDGGNPSAGVIMDAKGNLYGDTAGGGAYGYGTVYELSTKGTLTLLHSFRGYGGKYPFGSLIRDAKGDLYGTTTDGGSDGVGTVWKLTP